MNHQNATKKYSEIYPMERWAERISESLENIANEKPNMYAKTKQRYENLACSLLDSVSKIAVILEEDSLVSKNTDEFNELDSPSHNQIICKKIQDLTKTFEGVMNLSESHSNTNSPNSNSSSFGSSSSNYRKTNSTAMNYFEKVLKESTIVNFGYSEVNHCMKLLYKWFHTRFRPETYNEKFRYNISYIPEWIDSFIVLYGKYHSLGKNDSFESMLDVWCTRVESESDFAYALPYEVYQVGKDKNPKDFTIDAVVIYDLLFNGSLYKLSEDEFDGVIHLEYDKFISTVKSCNPALHPKISTRIPKRKQLISEIGLTPVGGSDTNG